MSGSVSSVLPACSVIESPRGFLWENVQNRVETLSWVDLLGIYLFHSKALPHLAPLFSVSSTL